MPLVARDADLPWGKGGEWHGNWHGGILQLFETVLWLSIIMLMMMIKVEELSPVSNLAGTWTSRTCEQWPGPKVAKDHCLCLFVYYRWDISILFITIEKGNKGSISNHFLKHTVTNVVLCQFLLRRLAVSENSTPWAARYEVAEKSSKITEKVHELLMYTYWY